MVSAGREHRDGDPAGRGGGAGRAGGPGGGGAHGVDDQLVAGIGVVHGDGVGDDRPRRPAARFPVQVRTGLVKRQRPAGGGGVAVVDGVVGHLGEGVGHRRAGVGGLPGVGDGDRVADGLAGHGEAGVGGLDDRQRRGQHVDRRGAPRVGACRTGSCCPARSVASVMAITWLPGGSGVVDDDRAGDRHRAADRDVPGPHRPGRRRPTGCRSWRSRCRRR